MSAKLLLSRSLSCLFSMRHFAFFFGANIVLLCSYALLGLKLGAILRDCALGPKIIISDARSTVILPHSAPSHTPTNPTVGLVQFLLQIFFRRRNAGAFTRLIMFWCFACLLVLGALLVL